MILKCKILGIDAGKKHVAILNKNDAEELGIRALSRIRIKAKKNQLTSIVNVSETIVEKGYIGIYNEIRKRLNLNENEEVEVEVADYPISLDYIKKKLMGKKLEYFEIKEIVKDVVEGNLSEIEISSFVTSLHCYGLSLDEIVSLTLAMVETGKTLRLKKRVVMDKHSLGGTLADTTSLILVPIIASLNLAIPKTSSRAITSPSGTADKAECLMNVNLSVEEMEKVVEKANGCLVWGGSLHLAPADDIFVQVEHPLSIDPLMLPSIMAKKKAVNSKYLVIDIPLGRDAKVKSMNEANILSKDFINLGKKLFIKTSCIITNSEQPIGYSIGPSLEAKEALEILMQRRIVENQIEKVCSISKALLEMVGKQNGYETALNCLKSGKAEKKLRQIIELQGGDPEIMPEDIEVGSYQEIIKSERKGMVFWIDNSLLTSLARFLGAPKYKGAGILLFKKIGDRVEKNEPLLKLFAEKQRKLEKCLEILEENSPFGIGEKREMVIEIIKEREIKSKPFILER